MVKKRFDETGKTYNLIFMEIDLPVCNGNDAADMIRAYLSNYTTLTPFICLVAWNVNFVTCVSNTLHLKHLAQVTFSVHAFNETYC